MQIDGKIAAVYAGALFELVQDDTDTMKSIEESLQALEGVFNDEQAVWKFFASPVMEPEHKIKVLRKVLKGQITSVLLNFLCLLAQRRRMDALGGIMKEYESLVDDHLGRQHVSVSSSRPLAEDELAGIRQVLKDRLKREIIIEARVQKDLVGGLIIQAGDVLIDTSIKSKLKRVRKQMMDQRIFGEKYYEN